VVAARQPARDLFRDQAGDENWQPHRVDVESDEVRALTPGPGVYSRMHQISAQFTGEALIAQNGRDRQHHDIYRVNVATGESVLHFQNDNFAWTFTNPQFRVMFGARYRADGGYDLVIATGPDTGKVFRRIEAQDSATTRPIEASSDGRLLYWLDSEDRDRAALVVNDLSTGSLKLMMADKAANYGEPVLDPVSARPLAIPAVYTRRRWEIVDPAISPDLDLIRASSEGELRWFGMSNDRKEWIAYVEQPASPGRYIHFSRKTRRIRRLFSARPAESEQIVAALQQRKIPVTYAFYKDEGHGFRRAENRRSWAAVVEAFLAQHLGGRAEPVDKDFDGSSLEFRAGRELIKGLG
jgi:hypothetical protein